MIIRKDETSECIGVGCLRKQRLRNLENGVQNNNNTFSYRKKAFLDRIKSSNPDSQNKYKRVVLSTIRYAGGKVWQ